MCDTLCLFANKRTCLVAHVRVHHKVTRLSFAFPLFICKTETKVFVCSHLHFIQQNLIQVKRHIAHQNLHC